MADSTPAVIVETRPGRLTTLTSTQRSMLSEFRKKLEIEGLIFGENNDAAALSNGESPHHFDDHHLLRFLRARQFSFENAYEMFVNFISWRNEHNVSALIDYKLDSAHDAFVQKYFPRFYHKTDLGGRPVFYAICTHLDPNAFMKFVDHKTFFNFWVASCEDMQRMRFTACSAVAGRHIEECFSVIDLNHVSSYGVLKIMKFLEQISEISSNYYPESSFKTYCINTPMLVKGLFKIFPLDEGTRAKFFLVGSEYRKHLVEHISTSSLPKIYGGDCECIGGCQYSDAGPWKCA